MVFPLVFFRCSLFFQCLIAFLEVLIAFYRVVALSEVEALRIMLSNWNPLEEGHVDGNRTLEENDYEYTEDLRVDLLIGAMSHTTS